MTNIPVEAFLPLVGVFCVIPAIAMAFGVYQFRKGVKGIQQMIEEEQWSKLSPKSKQAVKVSLLAGAVSMIVTGCALAGLLVLAVTDSELIADNFVLLFFVGAFFLPLLISAGIALIYKFFFQRE